MAARTVDTEHHWKFVRVGGLDQVVIRDGADVVNLPRLDPKLWVALALPTRGVEFDVRTLELLDSDHDGRIRVPEVVAAAAWLREVLAEPDVLMEGGDSLRLAAIDGHSVAGRAVLAGTKRILANLGKPNAEAVTLGDVAATEKIFDAERTNGDGVVPLELAPDEATRAAMADVVATHGAVQDRSGKPGIDQARVEAFFAEVEKLAAWEERGERDEDVRGMSGAATAVAAVRAKVDDYFVRCRLAAMDDRAVEALSIPAATLQAIAASELSPESAEVARLPLARIGAGRPLALTDGVNPAWSGAIGALLREAVTPLLGGARTDLSEAEWRALLARLAEPLERLAEKPVTAVEKLGSARVRELAGGSAKQAMLDLIEADLAVEDEMEQIDAVEKLVRLNRDFVTLLNNFVSFSHFYGKRGAIFQVGTLYLDGRSCNLCVRVEDVGAHATLAGLAKTCLTYCECMRAGGTERMTIAAAFTSGDSDHLLVGRNGVFFDRQGRDWDARIVRIIENPISIRQAFAAPYKRLVRALEEQVAKRAGVADSSSHASLDSMASGVVAPAPGADPAKDVAAKKFDVGTVAALGVALGSIAAVVTALLGKFFDLGRWLPLGIVGLILAISGPSMLIARLKLKERSLGPILDASGWAVNGRARVSVPFGRALTDVAAVPPGSQRTLTDPYAEKQVPWVLYAVLVAILVLGGAWAFGKLDRVLPARLHSSEVLRGWVPVQKEAPPAPAATPPGR